MPAIKLLLSFLLFFLSSNAFAVNYNLPDNQWNLISLPANPPSSKNTIAKVFGDDIPAGTYGIDWVLYQYNTQENSYGEPLELNHILEQGRGYWIIQKTGSPVTLAMPADSSEAPESFALKIAPITGNNNFHPQWTLSGNPFSSPQTLGGFFLKTDSGICSNPACELDKSETENIFHNQVWSYDGEKYVLKNTQDVLNPWDGFWAASLENSQGHSLSLQKSNTSPSGNWYVKPNGSDLNNGRSINSAFATITHASELAEAGDNIIIKAGEYFERVEIRKSGKQGNPISYIGEQGVVLNGSNLVWGAWDGLFDIDNKEYINVSGIQIINSTWAGFSIENSEHIIVENNTTVDTKSSGIYVGDQSRHITVNGNKISGACKGGSEEALSIVDSHYVTVSYNEVSKSGTGENNNGGEGIDIKNGSQNVNVFNNHVHDNPKLGIYIDAWNQETSNINIYNNRVHNIGANGITLVSEKSGELKNIKVFNNIVHHNDEGGIFVAGRDWLDNGQALPSHNGTTPMDFIRIINNTVYGNKKDGIYIDNLDAKHVYVKNNISSNNIESQVGRGNTPEEQVTFTYNLSDGNLPLYNTSDAPNYTGDPKFVIAEPTKADDFRLSADSIAAINKGISTADAPTTDFDGNTRGTPYDIGAFEYR